MSPEAAIFKIPRIGPALSFLCVLFGCLELRTIGAAAAPEQFTTAERSHWAFQPVQVPEVPVERPGLATHPVDAFIWSKLRARQIQPAASTDKITLLRRATFDLTGLPPTPSEVDAFLDDDSADAFERVVDRLLASPQYGERWARHWLDLARYAESEGFKADETRPNAWRYRDYVIDSFNRDKPYDRFIREQIAGDELWPSDSDARVATAFNRHYPDESNARNLMQRRQEILNDITDTVGAVFTGLTYGCARCHDHKFDPIRQSDYYRLQAFFANAAAADHLVLASPKSIARHGEAEAQWDAQTCAIREQIAALEEPARQEIIKEFVDKYPEPIQAALLKPEATRSAFECQMVAKAKLYLLAESPQYIAASAIVASHLKGNARSDWDELQQQLQQFASLRPPYMPIGTGITDLGSQAPPTYILRRGNWDAPKAEVEPGFLSLLDPNPAQVIALSDGSSTGRRTALANILADPRNPLTARVMVNRIWHYHFGRGIVGTPSDFGFKGERPTHPELLDWLAAEFVRHNWSMKHMHRLIMTSSTYQQSSAFRPDAANLDPDNKLLWRFPRRRLEAEAIRDASLAVSGLLNPRMGGPSVFPELPQDMRSRGGWRVTEDAGECDRRSIYIFVRRNTRYPLMEAFDMPDTHESCGRRASTTSPIQALSMLNSNLSLEWARNFAARVLRAAGSDENAQTVLAYRLAFARLPTPKEQELARAFWRRQSEILQYQARPSDARAESSDGPPSADAIRGSVLVDFCHMLLNANEFVYLN